jgi:hypothetical protein
MPADQRGRRSRNRIMEMGHRSIPLHDRFRLGQRSHRLSNRKILLMNSTEQSLVVVLLVLLSVGYLLWLVKKPKTKKSCHHDCGCHKKDK